MIFKIAKISGKMVKDSKGNINVSYDELNDNGMIVGISDSQLVTWLYELKGLTMDEVEAEYSQLKGKRKTKQMKELEFIEELVQVEYSTEKQFVERFILNGVSYVWLNSKGDATNSYIKESISEEIIDRLDNGRDKTQKFIAAKLNAYHGLALSSSRRVKHQPTHVVVVNDNVTTFEASYISVTTKGVKEITEQVSMESSDGNGLIDYKLLDQWCEDMNYQGHKSSGVSIRNAFVKGMVFPVDLQEFFKENNVTEIVDVWGNTHKTDDIDMIIPTSMHKLWQSYSNWDEYEMYYKANGYEFRVCKESHDIKMGRTNYQMTTDMQLNDEQIKRFITPTIEYLKDIAGRDWLSTVLYLNGQSLTESSTNLSGIEQALMVMPQLIHDKTIVHQIQRQLRRRKQDTCCGRYNVESDYQIISSDLYHFLCDVCGIKHDGLLKAGEVYSQWHSDRGYEEALLFRAPMIEKHNIAKVKLVDSEELRKFYKHMSWTVVLNDWDLTVDTLCGADKDGDTVMVITDKTLLEVHEKVLPCRCEAVKGVKVVCDDRKVLMQGAKLGCNDKKYNIGTCINHITDMFSVRSMFSEDSKEYKELSDRIILGTMISQGYIDFKKNGTVVMEMPKHWYSLKDCETEFDKRICADKKPYFLCTYQAQAKDTRNRCKDVMEQLELRANCYWGISADELLAMSYDEMNDDQRLVVEHWSSKLAYYLQDKSTQHRMCVATENALKEIRTKDIVEDCSELLKNTHVPSSNTDIEKEIKSMLLVYNKELKNIHSKKDKLLANKKDVQKLIGEKTQELREQLKVAVLDLHEDSRLVVNCFINASYNNNTLGSLIWELFSEEVINNLLEKNNYEMQIPVSDSEGEYEYQSRKFTIKKVTKNLQ